MGGPTRFPYGLGIGFQNQFQFTNGPVVSGTANLFAQSDATPDVTIGDLFIANNAAATTITYFDLQSYATKAAEYGGKMIRVLVVDQGSTQFANSGQMYLYGTNNLATRNSYAMFEFVHLNSAWVQISNSELNRREVANATVAGTIALTADNVDDRKMLFIVGTAATTIVGISGGQVGQELFIMSGSAGNAITINSAANLAMASTNAFVLHALGAAHFIKRDANVWQLVTPTAGGI